MPWVLLGGLQTNSTMGEPDAQLSPAAKLLLEMPMEVALVIAWQLLSPLAYAGSLCGHQAPLAEDRRRADPDHAARDPAEMWPIVNEAARRWLVACSEAERKQVARRQQDCWLGLRRARAGSAACAAAVPADAAAH